MSKFKFIVNICDFCPRKRVCKGENCTVKRFEVIMDGKREIGIVRMEFKD